MLEKERSNFRGGSDDPYRFYSDRVAYVIQTLCENKSTHVLDYGCGEQPFRALIEKLGATYTSFDVQQNRKETVDFLDVDKLPKSNFDVALFSDVIEHCEDPDTTLDYVFSSLKPGSAMLLTTPFLYREHEGPHDYLRFTRYSLEKKLNFYGKIIYSETIGNALNVSKIAINEGITSKNFVGRVAKYITLRCLSLMNSRILYHFSEETYFAHIYVIQK